MSSDASTATNPAASHSDAASDSSPRPSSGTWPSWIVRCTEGVAAAAVFVATVYLASWALSDSQAKFVTSAPLAALLFAIVALLLVGAAVHEFFHWRRPMRRLVKLLDELNKGEAPLEELNNLAHGVADLREPLRDLLHQVRVSRKRVNELHAEIERRVVNRTDVLERKLGSLQAQASRDALTGLMNRRAMELELPRLVRECRQRAQPLQLLMVDVDHFKTLNDTLGHAAGDELLRSIGQLMRSSLREGIDHAFRYGGDEFVIVMPSAEPDAALTLSERLKHLVDGLTKHHRQLPRRPQLSIGSASLANVAGLEDPAAGLLSLADERLYAIKHARPKSAQRVA